MPHEINGSLVAAEALLTPHSRGKFIWRHASTMSRSGATQAKDRLYAQLASSLKNMSRAVGQTADLMEQLQNDLDAMRVLAGTHAAQCVARSNPTCFELDDSFVKVHDGRRRAEHRVGRGRRSVSSSRAGVRGVTNLVPVSLAVMYPAVCLYPTNNGPRRIRACLQ